MPLPINRYVLDPTGISSDNLVTDEVHELMQRDVRAVAPIYGAFFTDGLVVYDDVTNQPIQRGTQFQCVELLQDASAHYGKEICCVILILDKTVSNRVRISYQVVGGHFQNDASGLINLYQTAIQDNRPVDWVNILNRPTEFPPTMHLHMLEDVYGFQAVVAMLERVRNAIILSDVPAFEALIDWVNGRVSTLELNITELFRLLSLLDKVENLPVVTEDDILSCEEPHKYVTQDRLMFGLRYYGLIPTATLTLGRTVVPEGYILQVGLTTENIAPNANLYWTIEHHGTSIDDFTVPAGIIHTTDSHGSFNVAVVTDYQQETNESFKICIRVNSITGPIIRKSEMISIQDVTQTSAFFDTISAEMMRMCCFRTPVMLPTPTSMHVILTSQR